MHTGLWNGFKRSHCPNPMSYARSEATLFRGLHETADRSSQRCFGSLGSERAVSRIVDCCFALGEREARVK